MGVQLKPQQNFTVVRQISNHLDSGTYYVQAVIRNAYTDAVLATLNLDDKGSQRFSKNWQVPADVSGQGFYLSIVTSVYTDSGYTTKSENYGDEESTHLVAELPTGARFGGGGGIGISDVRRVISEELRKLQEEKPEVQEEPEEKVEAPKIPDYSDKIGEIMSAVGYIQSVVEKIPTEKTNLSSIESGIRELKQAIQDKEVTPETNLTPIIERLSELDNDNDLNLSEVKDMVSTTAKDLLQAIEKGIPEAINKTKFVSQFSTFAAPHEREEQKEKSEEKPFDLNKFTS